MAPRNGKSQLGSKIIPGAGPSPIIILRVPNFYYRCDIPSLACCGGFYLVWVTNSDVGGILNYAKFIAWARFKVKVD